MKQLATRFTAKRFTTKQSLLGLLSAVAVVVQPTSATVARAARADRGPSPASSASSPASSTGCIGQAVPPGVEHAVACVQWAYDQSRTFQASFEQRFTVKAYATEKSSSGQVFFEKPGKMLWKYSSPQNNRV